MRAGRSRSAPASGYRALSTPRSLTCSVSAECVHELSDRFARLARSDLRALSLHAFLLDLLLCVETDLEADDRSSPVPRWLSEASGLVNRLLLDRAERLLRTTLLDVTEIAYSAGFGNLSYFYRLFRERYGCSPRAFREYAQRPLRVR
ncbi:MAG: helix-turn-helix domain-containing protein [Spirochaetota bacterium]